MFTLDRARGRRRVRVQPRRDAGSRSCSRTRSAMHGGRPPVYFEPAAVIVVARAARPGARAARPQPHERGDSRTPRSGCAPAARRVEARRRDRRAAGTRRRRRPTAGASGRARARRRRRDRGLDARSTNRWSQASRCPSRRRPGARVTGGTVNGTGTFVMRAERVGNETLLAQIVRMVGEAQRIARADPAARRPGGGDGSCRPSSPSRWSPSSRGRISGPEPRLALRPGERGRRADHRLPVRARPGHADVDHGRHRPGRGSGRLIRDAEALELMEKVDDAGRRQDRHADRREAAAGQRRAAERRSTSGRCSSWRRAWKRSASTRLPRRSSRGARAGHRAGSP